MRMVWYRWCPATPINSALSLNISATPMVLLLPKSNRSATSWKSAITWLPTEIPKVIQASCMQCHSYERGALQRRTGDGDRMPDTKFALFTNTENVTASSGLCSTTGTRSKKHGVPHLAKQFPLTSAVWTKWQAKGRPDYAGTWKIVGHDAGKGGDYTGQVPSTLVRQIRRRFHA